MVWAPNTTKRSLVGADDTPAQAATYLETVVGTRGGGPARALPRRGAQSDRIPRSHTPRAPDTRAVLSRLLPRRARGDAAAGACWSRSRSMRASSGTGFPKLRPPLPEFTLFGGMMVARADIAHFRNVFKSARSALRVARLVAGYGADRLRSTRDEPRARQRARRPPRQVAAGLGSRSCSARRSRDCGGTAARGRHRGAHRLGRGSRWSAARRRPGFRWVLHSDRLRRELLPVEAGDASAAADGNTGDGIDLGRSAGGLS